MDTIAPVFGAAAVNGATLTMTYNEAINGAAAPQASSFSVVVDGAAVDVNAVAVAGQAVTLTLASAVLAGDVVLVSYTDPTTGNDALAIQDLAGNDAVSVLDAPVTNNKNTGTPPALVAGAAEVDGTTLTLTFNERVPSASVCNEFF